jgi:hypothetical protein
LPPHQHYSPDYDISTGYPTHHSNEILKTPSSKSPTGQSHLQPLPSLDTRASTSMPTLRAKLGAANSLSPTARPNAPFGSDSEFDDEESGLLRYKAGWEEEGAS